MGSMMVTVRAHPRSSRTRLEWDGSVLHAWVTAPPVGGAANRALVEAVAGALGVGTGRIRLAAGASGRGKRLELEGVDPGLLETLRP